MIFQDEKEQKEKVCVFKFPKPPATSPAPASSDTSNKYALLTFQTPLSTMYNLSKYHHSSYKLCQAIF